MLPLAPTAAACVACRTRECCRDRDAPLTGADVVRIATTLEVAPTAFATTAPAESRSVGGTFVVRDRRVRLVLMRRAEPDGHTACVFLLTLGSGRRACGLGALAPLACRLHPASDLGPGQCWRVFSEDEVAPARAAWSSTLATDRAAWRTFLADIVSRTESQAHPPDLALLLDALLAYPRSP